MTPQNEVIFSPGRNVNYKEQVFTVYVHRLCVRLSKITFKRTVYFYQVDSAETKQDYIKHTAKTSLFV